MSKIIVLIGAPGAGKGTQARLLQERLQLPQISTGDIFRALKEADTPLARQIRAIMDSGQLVPDELTVQLVRQRTEQPDCEHGYVLDGFPRTLAQAEMLNELARTQQKTIQAIVIDVPRELLEKRMVGRRNCPICGEIYNIYFKPPKSDNVCDLHPEAQLVHRADDKPETVKARLATYDEQTLPMLEFYRSGNLLHVVDGTKGVENIYADIERIIRNDTEPLRNNLVT
jgi:adenylate kinase